MRGKSGERAQNGRWKPALAAVCLWCALPAWTTQPLAASIFVVDDTRDIEDAVVGDGICAAVGTGTCTLRAAIAEANFGTTTEDEIELPAGTFEPATALSFGYAVQGPLRIRGAGRTATIVVGGASSSTFSTAFGVPLALEDLRVIGSAIGRGPLDVSDVEITGGVGFEGSSTLRDCTVGGGAAQNGSSPSDSLVERCVFEGGRVGLSVRTGAMTVVDSIIRRNGSDEALADTGGIGVVDAELTLVRTLIEDNEVTRFGGGIHLDDGTARLVDSAVIGNRALTGGGIRLTNGAEIVVVDSTLSGNVADLSGGGVAVCATCAAHFFSATITGNVSDFELSGGQTGVGGGLQVESGGLVTLRHTILHGNLDLFVEQAHLPTHGCSGEIVSEGHNLHDVAVISGCTIVGARATDRRVSDAGLGTLARFAGGPPVHPLRPDSPALDAGDPAGCEDDLGPLVADQRGAIRPFDGDGDGLAVCDIGAFERNDTDLLFDGFESGDLSLWSEAVP